MSDYKLLARLLDIQAQPGVDQEGNLLLLSLVSLLNIVNVMNKQLVDQSNLPVHEEIKNNLKDPAVNYGNRVKDIEPPGKKNNDLKAIENSPLKDAREKNKANDKIVNKITGKSGNINSKIIKWDSRLKKKIKEPLYI
ncbi:hypothetical protein [Desulfolucanica intricata]|uniref:hypothetical protein n=1 Tax=Desulfolucanica intricata TaxID=1285191 RepID=UPI00082FF6FE|nr:hypothetical protein [Desulfolucanica intricata]